MRTFKPIHPFPARMASDIALGACRALQEGSLVLDPMVGSGTVLRAAAEAGHRGIGFDMDPMAVLLSKVWTTPVNTNDLEEAAANVVHRAETLSLSNTHLPWIDEDEETQAFIDYWFAREQKDDLRKLATILQEFEGPLGNTLRVALSRLIITKQRGASLAGDVSHSRPHRIRTHNDFKVLREFRKSVNFLARRLDVERLRGTVTVRQEDARQMKSVANDSVNLIVTSPPYLNAIDYLRGHRLSLVWLGHTIGSLRAIRSESVGAERAPDSEADLALAKELTASVDPGDSLPNRRRRMIDRYALDMQAFMQEAFRVLKPTGKAVLVIGDSCHRDVYVKNSEIVRVAAEAVGFTFVGQKMRQIPPSRRYMPPPSKRESSTMKRRMRTEAVQTYLKS